MSIKKEIINKTVLLTINRPEKYNALNIATVENLGNEIVQAQGDDSIRTIILTGSGDKSFVSGADIKEMEALDSVGAKEYSLSGHKLMGLIENSEKPVICAVNGFAFGGGCELAIGCHIRYCSENALFALPEVGLGLLPGWGGTQRLKKIVGVGIANELILSGKHINADRALNINLVSKVVPPDTLIDQCLELSSKINSNGPIALKDCISLVNNEKVVYNDEIELFSKLFSTADTKEGLSAFIQKRKADFKNK